MKKIKKIGEHTVRGVVIGLSIELALLTFLVAAEIAALIYIACTDEKHNPPAGVPRNEGNSACPLAGIIGFFGILASPIIAATNVTGASVIPGATIGFLHGLYKETISNNREERNQIEHRPT